eukprot:6180926-Pleurochrysis_carterae.AAC.2
MGERKQDSGPVRVGVGLVNPLCGGHGPIWLGHIQSISLRKNPMVVEAFPTAGSQCLKGEGGVRRQRQHQRMRGRVCRT